MKERIAVGRVRHFVRNGLLKGGFPVDGLIKCKGPRRTFWWVDVERGAGFSVLCGFRLSQYCAGVWRLTAYDLDGSVPPVVFKHFGLNGLKARGVSELTFAFTELSDYSLWEELGLYFSQLVRGCPVSPTRFVGERARDFPGYAWTAAGWAAYEEHQSATGSGSRG